MDVRRHTETIAGEVIDARDGERSTRGMPDHLAADAVNAALDDGFVTEWALCDEAREPR